MNVFIVQHGDALPESADHQRPLSEKGIAQVKRMSEFLKKLPEYPDLILHSSKRRAIETAEIISLTLGGIKNKPREYLNPKGSTNRLIEELNSSSSISIMIVGHMPFLDKLSRELLGFQGETDLIELKNASPLILKRVEKGYVIDSYIRNAYIK